MEKQLYVHLYHGRQDPEEHMESWGFWGPVIGPITSLQLTYANSLRLLKGSNCQWLDMHKDLIVYDGEFYGDLDVCLRSAVEADNMNAVYQHERKQREQRKETDNA